MRMGFGYSSSIGEETGIYIVCNDKNIMENINSMMHRNGMIKISDTAGRTHYMIDARKMPTAVVDKINEIMLDSDINSLGSNTKGFNYAIKRILEEYRFDFNLIGTDILRFLIRKYSLRVSDSQITMKHLYLLASEEFRMTCDQIERDVRYSIRKSGFSGARGSYNTIGYLSERAIHYMNQMDDSSYANNNSQPHITGQLMLSYTGQVYDGNGQLVEEG